MFDVKLAIALHAMQGNRTSSRGVKEVSRFFSRCGGNLGYILKLQQGWPFKTRLCSVTLGLLSSCEEHLGILLEFWQCSRDTSRDEAGDPESLSRCLRDIGIPINFQEE